jgi:hypothetical protein
MASGYLSESVFPGLFCKTKWPVMGDMVGHSVDKRPRGPLEPTQVLDLKTQSNIPSETIRILPRYFTHVGRDGNQFFNVGVNLSGTYANPT